MEEGGYQQCVHVVVQPCAHLHVFAVVGRSNTTSLWGKDSHRDLTQHSPSIGTSRARARSILFPTTMTALVLRWPDCHRPWSKVSASLRLSRSVTLKTTRMQWQSSMRASSSSPSTLEPPWQNISSLSCSSSCTVTRCSSPPVQTFVGSLLAKLVMHNQENYFLHTNIQDHLRWMNKIDHNRNT